MNNLSFNKMNYLLFSFNKNNWFFNIIKCLYYCRFLLLSIIFFIMFVIMIVITFIILYSEYYFRNNF